LKCKIQEGKGCTQVPKECNDYEEGLNICNSLSAGSSKNCILNNGNCESHYINCNFDGVNEEKCKANIPADSTQECVWDTSTNTCSKQKKKCEGTKGTYFTNDYTCSSLSVTDSDKFLCLYSNNGCIQQYKTCELYNDNNDSNKKKEDCESWRIKESEGSTSYSHKCVFNGGNCKTGTTCSDFTYEIGCINFSPSDPDKKCVFINNHCEEQYKTCELYNTKEATKSKDTCEKFCLIMKEMIII